MMTQNLYMQVGKEVSITGMNTSIYGGESLKIFSLGTQEPHLDCALGNATYSGSLSGYVRQVVDDYVNPQLTTLLS